MIEIREAGREDWPAIHAIHDAARPDELRGSCDPRAFVPLAQDPELAELQESLVLVAVADNRPVGFTAVDGDYLGWLYVHPDFYRRGIGRQLLRAALARVEGAAWTIVLDGNRPAISLYESEGFREVARSESDNSGYPVTCLRMRR